MKKILVTGGAGFIGANLVKFLIDEKKSKDLLEKYKSVRLAIENGKKNK